MFTIEELLKHARQNEIQQGKPMLTLDDLKPQMAKTKPMGSSPQYSYPHEEQAREIREEAQARNQAINTLQKIASTDADSLWKTVRDGAADHMMRIPGNISPGLTGSAGTALYGIGGLVNRYVRGVNSAVNLAAEGLGLPQELRIPDEIDPITGALIAAGDAAQKKAERDRASVLQGRDPTLYDDVFHAMGSSAPFMLLGAAGAGLAGKTGQFGRALAYALSKGGTEGVVEGGSVFRDVLRQGGSLDEAHNAMGKTFAVQFPINIATDFIGDIIAGPAGSGITRKMLGRGFQEGLQEPGQAATSDVLGKRQEDGKLITWGDFARAFPEMIKNLPEAMKREGLPAAISAALTGGAEGLYGKAMQKRETQTITQPKNGDNAERAKAEQLALRMGQQNQAVQAKQAEVQKRIDTWEPLWDKQDQAQGQPIIQPQQVNIDPLEMALAEAMDRENLATADREEQRPLTLGEAMGADLQAPEEYKGSPITTTQSQQLTPTAGRSNWTGRKKTIASSRQAEVTPVQQALGELIQEAQPQKQEELSIIEQALDRIKAETQPQAQTSDPLQMAYEQIKAEQGQHVSNPDKFDGEQFGNPEQLEQPTVSEMETVQKEEPKKIPPDSKLRRGTINVDFKGKKYKIDVNPWEKSGHKRLYLNEYKSSGSSYGGKAAGYYDVKKGEFVSQSNNAEYSDAVKREFENNITGFYNSGGDVSGSAAPVSLPGKETAPAAAEPSALAGSQEPLGTESIQYLGAQGHPLLAASDTKTEVTDSDKTISPEEPKVKTPSRIAAEEIAAKLGGGEVFKNSRELFDITDKAFGGTQAEGKYDVKDAYDALELGVNFYIKEKGYNPSAVKSAVDVKTELGKMTTEILDLIPTQTNRTEEQNEFQQFSTPPNIAYVANWLLDAGKGDVVLEPSAGIGGLAVFAQNSGAEIIANELSPRRADVLREMGFSKVFTENAEQIHNILPGDVRPTKVIMNPPFSSTAGRIKGQRNTKNATVHVEQALKRLNDGGRAVLILGKGMADDAGAFSSWWDKIKGEYNVRANIEIDGKEYRKYGTSFGCVMAVIDKTGATPAGGTITGKFDAVADAIDALAAVRESGGAADVGVNKQSHKEKDELIIEAILTNGRTSGYPEFHSREWAQSVVDRMDDNTKTAAIKVIDDFKVKSAEEFKKNNPNMEIDEKRKEQLWKGLNSDLDLIVRDVTMSNPAEIDAYDKDRRRAHINEHNRKEREKIQIKAAEEDRIKKRDEGLINAIRTAQRKITEEDAQQWIKQLLTEEEKDALAAERQDIVNKFPFGKERTQAYRDFSKKLESMLIEKHKVRRETKKTAPMADVKKETPEELIARMNRKIDETRKKIESGNLAEEDIKRKKEYIKACEDIIKEVEGEIAQKDAVGEQKTQEGAITETAPAAPTPAAPKKESVEVKQKTEEEIISAKAEADEAADDKAVYDTYTPAKMKIAGSVSHPADLVQSSAMAAVEPPDPTYSPKLPKELITSGKLSEAQLEAIVYAGQSFEQTLPNGARRGFFIGDGTGVGKGREISGILMDQLAQGHGKGKAVWISMNAGLLQDAKRDWAGLDNNPDDIFAQQESKNAKSDIRKDKGILFTAYTTIRADDRKQQLKDWLGEGFNGVIALDECHNANNAIDIKVLRGTKSASQQALAVQDLIEAFPDARILYVSATGATEVSNLSMLGRLGLWGEGTAFPNVKSFISQVTSGGTAAMELVARDMKAMGVYIARSLSHRAGKYGCGEDATFETLEHKLEDHQKIVYDRIVEAWQVVLQNIGEAVKMIAGTNTPRTAQKLSAASQFWSAHQRAFNQIITSMQTPAVINAIERDLKNGHSVVIQLTNTNEADQKRALAKLGDDETLDDFDATPRDVLINFLEKSFPVHQHEEKMDEKGNIELVPVLDSAGNKVLNKDAVAMRDKMISDIEKIAFPDSPIDMIINSFGADNVAEITGRTQRVIQKDGKSVLEKRPKAARESDKQDFQDGKKRILIFSEAGGTGASYHADRNVKNQQKRKHYLLQPGWKSASALQGLGRTLRSNQVHMPVYSLVTTDLPGQKRFISTIARRLEQLGALTTGERKAATQGLFSERDNLESTHANIAMHRLLDQMTRCGVGTMSAGEVFAQLGFSNVLDDNGKLNASKMPEMRQFLNRLLSLKYDAQQEVFGEFERLLDEEIKLAIERGTIDVGTETLKADSIEVLQERVVYTDEKTGSKTQYVEIEVGKNIKPVSFEKVKDARFFVSKRSGRIAAVYDTNKSVTDPKTGKIHKQYLSIGVNPKQRVRVKAETIENTDSYTQLTGREARDLWNKQSEELPKMDIERKHIISGALLPIWNKLEGKPQVLRIKSNDGRTFLGRVIPAEKLSHTLSHLGVTYESSKKITADDIIRETKTSGVSVKLANGWEFKESRVSGEKRIELVVSDRAAYNYDVIFSRMGIKKEVIAWRTRLFIPVGDMSASVIEEVLKISPAIEITGKDLMSQAAESINEGIEDFDINDYAGHTIKFINTENNPLVGESSANVTTEDIKFKNEEAERRYQESRKGVQRDSLVRRLGELVKGITHGLKSDFPDIMDSRFDMAREALRKLNRKKKVSIHDAILTLRSTVKDMSAEEYGLFSRKRILDDLMYQKSENPGSAIPYGFTDKQLEDEHGRISKAVKDNAKIQKAIEWEEGVIKEINNEMIRAADAIGWKSLSEKFHNPHYFRHVVLEYANAAANGTKKGLKAPDGRGYLKQRKGSEKDISANYIQAMGEVRAMQLQDIETMKTLKEIKDNYDIAEKLKAEAFRKNDSLFRGALFAAGLKETGNVLDAEEWAHKMLGDLNKRQAMAMAKLFEMAKLGNLPVGNFEDLVDAMADAGCVEELGSGLKKELNKYLGWLAGLKSNETGTIEARTYFKYVNVKKQTVKDTLGRDFVQWQDLLGDDYAEWHPFQNRLVFSAHTVAEHLINDALEKGMKELNIPLDKLNIVHVLGGHRQTWAIPKGLAETLNKIGTPTERSAIGKIAKEITAQWKEWVLLGPTRTVKYNIRNVTGDADAVLAANPHSFAYAPRAFQELANVYVKGQAASGELAEFAKRGGVVGAQHIQELGENTDVQEFLKLLDQGESGLRSMPKKYWHKYWSFARNITDFRENILRYATYLSYLEQMTETVDGETRYKDPKNWGASKKNEVAALSDVRDKAYKMANELLGAYDQVSETGQQLRDIMIPFYSWMEVNMKRYAQIFRNGMEDGNIGGITKRTIAGQAMKTPLYAWKAGKTVFKVSLFWTLIQVFNRLVMGDDDDELDPNVKGRPHITLGLNMEGNIIYFDRIGAFADVLDWFALDSAYTDIKDILNGHQSVSDYLKKMAQTPFSKLINGLNPLIKTPLEVVSGKKYFPDAFNPRTIRDMGVYVAETLGLSQEFIAATGRPSRGYSKSRFGDMFAYSANPDETAYWWILDKKRQFQENVLGTSWSGGTTSTRGLAIMNYKRALRFGDKKAQKKYLEQFIQYGGTRSGYESSIKSMHPLGGLSEADRGRFLRWLTPEDRKYLTKAGRYIGGVLSRMGEGDEEE